MRTLVIDIETAPNLVWVWDLHDVHVSIDQIVEPSRILCFAARWHGEKKGEKKIGFWSEWEHGQDGMIDEAHRLLDEAETVVHFNGRRFDIPHLQRQFVVRGLAPPAPYDQVDLLAAARQFKFPSRKLDWVVRELGIGAKVEHEGFRLWRDVMAGDAKAQARMAKYNRQDVRLTDELYGELLPWIRGGPNAAMADGLSSGCPRCGAEGKHLNRRGKYRNKTYIYHRYQCQVCGGWSRGVFRVATEPRATKRAV